MAEAKKGVGRGSVMLELLTSQTYVGIAVAGALVYFLVFNYMITYSSYGLFIVTVPIYLIYIMVGTAGILLSLSVYSAAGRLLRPAAEVEEGALSAILPSAGGLVATCACSYSLLGSMLIYFGVSSLAVSGIMSLVSAYQLWILIAIIFLNLLSVYYFSGRIASAECRVQRREARAARKS